MSHSLQRVSAALFYLLGLSFFGAYLLFKNDVFLPWSEIWLKVADLPLAFAAVLFGGSSLYASVHRKKKISWLLFLFVTVPLASLFVFLAILNFWDVLDLPLGQGI